MALRIIISGDVQGVFFRAFVKSRAHELGLRGFVRNLSNGDVEVVVQGPKEQIDELIKKCKNGPDIADVKDMKISEIKDQEFFTFEIKH